MIADIILDIVELGIIYAILGIGIYITFNILNTPDLSVDGSFAFGGVISAILCLNHMPFLGLILGFLGGVLTGLITSLLHTKLKIQVVLAGILTTTAFYSINLIFAGDKSSLNRYENDTIFAYLKITDFKIIPLIIIFLALVFSLILFFKSKTGLAIRATGDNEAMVQTSSIKVDLMKIIAFCLANGIVAFSGALFVQHQNTYSISSGTGMMVVGLAAIIIGVTIFRTKKLKYIFFFIALGAILHRSLIFTVLYYGGNPNLTKFLNALIVVIALIIPFIINKIKEGRRYA